MKSLLNSVVQVAACLFVASSLSVQAQDAKADVSGTWSWTQQPRGGGGGGEPRKSTLILKADGEKLTGKLTTPGRQGGEPTTTEITEGKVKDGEISFKISRQRQDTTFVMTYAGKVSGDSITGTVSFERGDQSRSREWTAKREAKATKE
jgi:hypothetical protein